MKKPFIVAALSLTSFFILSSLASAQTGSAVNVAQGIGTFAGLISGFTQYVVKAVGGLFMALAMVAFFYGIVQYIWGARNGDAAKVSNGNTFIKWSLVALFVMFSVYGIIRFGQGFICGGPCDNTIIIPDINFKTGAGTGVNPGNGGGVANPGNGGGLPVGGSQGALGATCISNSGCAGSLVCKNSQCAMPSESTGGSSGTGNVSCARANGGSCSIGGVAGTCVDWSCNTSGGGGNGGNVSCDRANGGSCSVGGVAGTCVDWSCNTSGGSGPVSGSFNPNESLDGCSAESVGRSCKTSRNTIGICQADEFGYACY